MKISTLRTLVLGFLVGCCWLGAQGQALIYGASPFQDSLWAIDTTAGFSVAARMAPTLAGFTITGINGMAYDPCQHETYVILKVSAVAGRVLAKINLSNGVCTQVGNLGDNFSSLTFDKNGQLYGVTGDGATVPETMYLINKTNGTKTLLTALGNGADGEVICFNPFNGWMFHWSGNGTVIYEKLPIGTTYTPTAINGSLGSGETFGALNLGPNRFMISTINSNLRYVDTLGVVSGPFGSLPDDLRGLVMPPSFTFTEDTICAKQTASFVYSGYTTDTVFYSWGDGTIDTLVQAGSATHTYLTPGTRTPRVILRNGCNPSDTVMTASLLVLNSPGVTLTPGLDTLMCFADTLHLVGTSGGTSQWLQNGAPISGASTNQYNATVSGVYNMVKTNLNGCSDSAAVGISILFGDQPAVDLTGDTTLCGQDSLCFTLVNPGNVSYLWSDGSTGATACATSSGLFGVMAMDSVGCVAEDSLLIAFRDVPVVSFNIDSTQCPTYVFNGTGVDVDTYAWSFGDGGTSTLASPSHTYGNGVFTVSVDATNPCGTDNASITLVVTCAVSVLDGNFNAVQVYPNPNKGEFTLHAQLAAAGDLSYRLVDLSGRTLYTADRDALQSEWQERIRVQMPSGMYFLHLVSGDSKATVLVVME